MNRKVRTIARRSAAALCAAAGTLAITAPAPGAVYINEVYFDSPSSDKPNEYVELRGTPGESLANTYLVFLENEMGIAGQVDNVFNLSTRSIGSNGYLLLRMRNSQFTSVIPGTTDLINTAGGTNSGFGHLATSSIGHSNSNQDGEIENGGFSAFLIRVENGAPAPVLDDDLDLGDDGLDTNPNYGDANPDFLAPDWRILDSIGQNEVGEDDTSARSYAAVQFSAQTLTNLEDGAVNVAINNFLNAPLEPEYLARWGDSTGFTPDDWFVANLTNNTDTGFTAGNRWTTGFRVSGQHPSDNGGVPNPYGEVWRGFTESALPYGAIIQDNMGSMNVPEPAGLSLVSLGAGVALLRRKGRRSTF